MNKAIDYIEAWGVVDDVQEFKIDLEQTLGKRMDRPLFIAKGKGGGQTYKTLYEVSDSHGNANTPCYFFNENNRAIKILLANGHKSLDSWIKGVRQ